MIGIWIAAGLALVYYIARLAESGGKTAPRTRQEGGKGPVAGGGLLTPGLAPLCKALEQYAQAPQPVPEADSLINKMEPD